MEKISFEQLQEYLEKALSQGIKMVNAVEGTSEFEEEVEKFSIWLDEIDKLVEGLSIDDLESTLEEKKTLGRQFKILLELAQFFD